MTSLSTALAGMPVAGAHWASGSPIAEVPGQLPAATGVTAYAWLLVALPLLGAAILLVGGRRTDRWGPQLAVALSWASFLVGLLILVAMIGRPTDERGEHLTLYSWVPAGQFQLDAGMQ